ncbi:MAG: hypothetical protein P1V20_11840 [Verrucomicrobiales bacterium]|nr:hypothetical protein [Verrucomicrobiales bacterium]
MFSQDNQEIDLFWRSVADGLDLDFRNSGSPLLSGSWQGYDTKVQVSREVKGGLTRFFTGFEIQIKHSFHTSFELTRQGIIQVFADMVGARDIQIGDYRFDSAVMIRGWNEDVVRFLFQSEQIRDTCLSLFGNSRYHRARITHDSISLQVPGDTVGLFEARLILQQLRKIADLLSEADLQFGRSDEIPEEEEVVEIEVPAVELPVEAAEPVEPEVKLQPIPEPPLPESDLLSLRQVFEALAEPDGAQRFDDSFKGQTVHWKGEPDFIVPTGNDTAFGTDATGWVANFTFRNPVGPTLKYRIGRERKEEFENRPGTVMEITGRLVSYDADSKSLYIDSGAQGGKADFPSATVLVRI